MSATLHLQYSCSYPSDNNLHLHTIWYEKEVGGGEEEEEEETVGTVDPKCNKTSHHSAAFSEIFQVSIYKV